MGDGFDGGGGGFDFSGLFDALLNSIADFLNSLLQFLGSLISAIGQALNFLFVGELGIFSFTRSIGEIAHSILKFIVDQIFKVWVVRGLQHLLDLYNKLRAWAQKLKKWLDKWRKLQQLTQGKALRDFINMIQRIRKLLVVFRILHLKFATKLDNWLATIEGTVIRKYFDFGRKTNEIIGWLNLFINPFGVLRAGGILGGVTNTLASFADALKAAGLLSLFPWLAFLGGPGVAVEQWSSVSAQFRHERRTGSGDFGAARAQLLQYKESFNSDIGGGAA